MTPVGVDLQGGGPNAFRAAAHWIQAVLLGPVSTSIAVIAVAFVGMGMLSGRVDVRRGATVILGCFILFGAANIAKGLQGLAGSAAGGPLHARYVPPPPEPPALPQPYVDVGDDYRHITTNISPPRADIK